MKRSRLSWKIGAMTCGLSLALFGCPPAADQVDNNDSGASAVQNLGGSPAGNTDTNTATGAGTDTGTGNTGSVSTTLDRSALIRPASPTLFAVDVTRGLMSFRNAHLLDGNAGPNTFIDALRVPGAFPLSAVAVAVDRTGTLILRATQPALNFYRDAATVAGNPGPDRQIGGLASRLADIADDSPGMVYDRTTDRLFVRTGDRVLVFEGEALSQNGEAPPTRVFSSPDFVEGESMALGPNGDLYLADGSQSVFVIAGAGLRSGQVAPDRTIFLLGFVTDNIHVDAADNLYVANGDDIAVLATASSLNGELAFEALPTMQLTDAVQPEIDDLVVDSRGIGYIADRANATIQIVDNIAARRGEIRGDRAIHGPDVKFARAFALFLWE